MKACVPVLRLGKQLTLFDVKPQSILGTRLALSQRQLASNSRSKPVSSESKSTRANQALQLREEASKRKHEDDVNQDLFLDVLESTTTKREAKAYLSHFGPQRSASPISKQMLVKSKGTGVNLGNLYVPLRVIDENSVFSNTPTQFSFGNGSLQSLHIALVKIRTPQSLDDTTLQGVAHTLTQLARLGMSCVIVIDPEDGQQKQNTETARIVVEQADRIVGVIEAFASQGARRLDSLVGIASVQDQLRPSIKISSGIHITDRELLVAPLRRGVTPIIAPLGLIAGTPNVVAVDADEVVLALTQDFAGLQTKAWYKYKPEQLAEKMKFLHRQISLDRIIVLDPLGGIPSTDRSNASHVFINLEQEFEAIKRQLVNFRANRLGNPMAKGSSTVLDLSPASASNGSAISEKIRQKRENAAESGLSQSSEALHIKNLELMKNTLALLPPSSSAFLTTSDAVANSQSRPPLASQGPRVRTRRLRNPLIHNLLTDKPVFSSSLPPDRSGNPKLNVSSPSATISPATFFKRGMPVAVIPDPLGRPWTAPSSSNPSINMLDPRIDLPRLVHLIEDSFSRKLELAHYLNRIKDRIAGVIIAGEYEGGAILTWETPPGYPANDPAYMVPYLDKFAVLKRFQGSGGVADIVFNAMVRDCFPGGVCWRSRKDNPVNKWYFERSKGTHRIPDTNWTMFWTTEGQSPGTGVFLDYQGVCSSVEPSWADKKKVAD